MAIAADYANDLALIGAAPTVVELSEYDQWSMQSEYDFYRPLYRVALNDAYGTQLYVSSVTGEIVKQTTRRERFWNYLGSVPHWLYYTALRGHRVMWTWLVWWLSLAALSAAVVGAIIGIARVQSDQKVGD